MHDDELDDHVLLEAYEHARGEHPELGPAELVDLIRARLGLPVRTERLGVADDPVTHYVRAVEGDEPTEED